MRTAVVCEMLLLLISHKDHFLNSHPHQHNTPLLTMKILVQHILQCRMMRINHKCLATGRPVHNGGIFAFLHHGVHTLRKIRQGFHRQIVVVDGANAAFSGLFWSLFCEPLGLLFWVAVLGCCFGSLFWVAGLLFG